MNTNLHRLLKQALYALLAVAALSAQATVVANAPKAIDFGGISAPFSVNYGNTFFSPTSQTFVDSYTFTLSEQASFNSFTASVNLGTFFRIDNISARLYQGSAPFPSGLTPIIQAWSTPFFAGPGTSGSTTVISVAALPANTYTLEILGDVIGLAGGSYFGVLNVAPVPEPEEIAMLLAGLAIVGWTQRRKVAIGAGTKT